MFGGGEAIRSCFFDDPCPSLVPVDISIILVFGCLVSTAQQNERNNKFDPNTTLTFGVLTAKSVVFYIPSL
jgi:hypothetical protein